MAQSEQFINYLTNQPTALTNATNASFGASGTSHSVGLVPDPGSSTGTTRFLREDSTWTVPNLTSVTNSLSGNISLNASGQYFDGPSCAQGTSGVWFASGTVTVNDSNVTNFLAKLWDGTTVISSTEVTAVVATNADCSMSLSGVISSPAGNIRISVRDTLSSVGLLLGGGLSVLTVIRIG